MVKPFSEMIGSPVMDAHEHACLGTIRGCVIDPKNGKVIAMDIGKGMLVATIDLLHSSEGLFVQHAHAVVAQDDIVRVAEIQKEGITFLGAKVWTEKGTPLGDVTDLLINLDAFALDTLDVAKQFLFWKRDNRLIPASAIVRVTQKGIIVKDEFAAGLKEKEPAAKSFMPEPA